jgi:hypothetical protein
LTVQPGCVAQLKASSVEHAGTVPPQADQVQPAASHVGLAAYVSQASAVPSQVVVLPIHVQPPIALHSGAAVAPLHGDGVPVHSV